MLLQESQEKCEKENSSDSCEDNESESARSDKEDTENNSHLSKEDRKLQRKVYVVLVKFLQLYIYWLLMKVFGSAHGWLHSIGNK